MDHVVTAFLRNRGEVLLVRRSDAVGTYPNRWGGVSGYVEGDPADAVDDARREVREGVGVDRAALTLVRAGDPVRVTGAGSDGGFVVHPFLFDCATRAVTRNEELAAHEWAPATAICDRGTVPRLWAAYRAVAPTVASVRDDRTHGSASLSVRALEALRDAAAEADDWEAVADTARALRGARPGMAALANRVNRVMCGADRTPTAVRDRAVAAIRSAADADDRAAAAAADLLSGPVLTLSRSGTVRAALDAHGGAVLVAASDPGGEGREVAAEVAGDGRGVTLLPDSAVAAALAERKVGAALVGADAVLPGGAVANKVGTRGLALAAAREGVPTYAVTARDKIRADGEFAPERAEFDPPEGVEGFAPLFDRTPADLVTVVTEAGALDADAIGEVAADHRALAAWDDADPEG